MGDLWPKWNFWEQPGFEWPTEEDKNTGLQYLSDHLLDEFGEWAERDHWNLCEAVSLSFGLDPKRAITPDGLFTVPKDSAIATHLLELHDRICNDQKTTQLPEMMCPNFFLGWARYNHVDYPQPLEKAVQLYKLCRPTSPSDLSPKGLQRWAAHHYWSADDAVALWQRGAPEDFWVTISDYYRWRFYTRQRQHFRKAFPDPVRPGVCLAWAKKNGFNFPKDIEEAVTRHEQDIIDLKPRYDALRERFEERERQITALHYDVEKRNMEIHKLRLELASAKSMAPTKPTQNIDDLEPRALNRIFTLLLAGLGRRAQGGFLSTFSRTFARHHMLRKLR